MKSQVGLTAVTLSKIYLDLSSASVSGYVDQGRCHSKAIDRTDDPSR
jgi:hypothetical protein